MCVLKRGGGVEGQREGERKPLEEGWTILVLRVMNHMHFPRQFIGLHCSQVHCIRNEKSGLELRKESTQVERRSGTVTGASATGTDQRYRLIRYTRTRPWQ